MDRGQRAHVNGHVVRDKENGLVAARPGDESTNLQKSSLSVYGFVLFACWAVLFRGKGGCQCPSAARDGGLYG